MRATSSPHCPSAFHPTGDVGADIRTSRAANALRELGMDVQSLRAGVGTTKSARVSPPAERRTHAAATRPRRRAAALGAAGVDPQCRRAGRGLRRGHCGQPRFGGQGSSLRHAPRRPAWRCLSTACTPASIQTGHRCVGFEQDDAEAFITFANGVRATARRRDRGGRHSFDPAAVRGGPVGAAVLGLGCLSRDHPGGERVVAARRDAQLAGAGKHFLVFRTAAFELSTTSAT